jgi:hypothetical protein
VKYVQVALQELTGLVVLIPTLKSVKNARRVHLVNLHKAAPWILKAHALLVVVVAI